MIRIEPRYLEAVENAAQAIDLFEALQKAIELEHATIPPYLLACYSLIEGVNTPIRKALLGIAKEEMLHMAIVCNVLNAIGGKPHIAENFVPQYPCAFPMSIGGDLVVGLKKFSLETLRDTFMRIEEPETPFQFPVREAAVPEFKTIGMFYSALIGKIAELGDSIFTGSPDRQVVVGAGFAQDRLFPITGVETATTALRWILEDGEGTSTSPLDVTGEPAHYYRFAEIFHGRSLVASPSDPHGYAYAGSRIAFRPEDVCDFPDNPKAADYAPGTFERELVDAFNLAYSNVLRDLQKAFDGAPAHIRRANSNMAALRGPAEEALRFVDSATGRNVGVSFEYTT